MRDNVIDKVYLALELTRLYIPERHKDSIFNKEFVKDTFDYFVSELTGIENISNYDDIVSEREKYKKMYEDLTRDVDNRVNGIIEYKLKAIKQTLDQCKGDMEPYVYKSLIELIK